MVQIISQASKSWSLLSGKIQTVATVSSIVTPIGKYDIVNSLLCLKDGVKYVLSKPLRVITKTFDCSCISRFGNFEI